MEEAQRLKLWADMDDPNFENWTKDHCNSMACTRDESPFAIGDKVIPKFKSLHIKESSTFPQTIVALKEIPGFHYAGELYVFTQERPGGFYACGLKIIIPELACERELFANEVIEKALNVETLTPEKLIYATSLR